MRNTEDIDESDSQALNIFGDRFHRKNLFCRNIYVVHLILSKSAGNQADLKNDPAMPQPSRLTRSPPANKK